LQIVAEFVTSAAGAGDFPRDRLPEIAMVGRSNVGKSSLINALVRRPLARTSAAPGKTRLANFYRVQRGSSPPLYLVDLPGYGYARGGDASAQEFNKHYGLSMEKLALARPDAIVMHPGPMNRGVEIDSTVADGPHSVILPQVTFGIAVRMAVMSIVAGN